MKKIVIALVAAVAMIGTVSADLLFQFILDVFYRSCHSTNIMNLTI